MNFDTWIAACKDTNESNAGLPPSAGDRLINIAEKAKALMTEWDKHQSHQRCMDRLADLREAVSDVPDPGRIG